MTAQATGNTRECTSNRRLDNGQVVPKGRFVQDKVQLLSTKRRQDSLQKSFQISGTTMRSLAMKRARRRSMLLIFASLRPRSYMVSATRCITALPERADAQDKEGQCFLLMPMDS